MKKNGYSDLESFGLHQYRYNYNTQCVEQLGKSIIFIEQQGRQVPVVGTSVLQSYPIKAEQFEKSPGYWYQLLDTLAEREHKSRNVL